VGKPCRLGLSTVSTPLPESPPSADGGAVEVQVRQRLLSPIEILGQGQMDVLPRARCGAREAEDDIQVIIDLLSQATGIDTIAKGL